jgi:hypothetical protein
MQMRKMSIITAGFLLTALAMPAAAQQLSEQEARAAVQNTIDIWMRRNLRRIAAIRKPRPPRAFRMAQC